MRYVRHIVLLTNSILVFGHADQLDLYIVGCLSFAVVVASTSLGARFKPQNHYHRIELYVLREALWWHEARFLFTLRFLICSVGVVFINAYMYVFCLCECVRVCATSYVRIGMKVKSREWSALSTLAVQTMCM